MLSRNSTHVALSQATGTMPTSEVQNALNMQKATG